MREVGRDGVVGVHDDRAAASASVRACLELEKVYPELSCGHDGYYITLIVSIGPQPAHRPTPGRTYGCRQNMRRPVGMGAIVYEYDVPRSRAEET